MKFCCLVLSKCSLYQYFIFFLLLSLFKNGASVTVPPSLPPGEDRALLGASAGAPCAAWRNRLQAQLSPRRSCAVGAQCG